MDELIDRLQQRILRHPSTDCECVPPIRPAPPVTIDIMREVEFDLGFRFPEFLVRLYTEVADGGFGPSWGINPLRHPTGMSIETWDREERSEWENGWPPSGWPEPFIRFCEVGCNIYVGVDCSVAEGRVIEVDPNRGSDDRLTWLTPLSESVAGWLGEWLDRKPWPETLLTSS